MTNLELYAKVTKAGIQLIDINGFKYKLTEVEIASLKNFKTLVPIFSEVEEGDYIRSTNWELTRMHESDDPIILCIRLNEVEIINEKDFKPLELFKAKVQGNLLTSSKTTLRTVGPSKKPFIRTTLKMLDEYGKSWNILLVGFNKMALRLDDTKRLTRISAEVTIKEKKFQPGYELNVNDFKVIKEGN